MNPETQHRLTWILATAGIYAALVLSTVTGPSRAFFEKHFRPGPFGVPAYIVAAAIVAVLFLPYIWFFWHICRVMMCLKGYTAPGTNLLRSVLVSLGALLYFFVICGAWIVYTAIRGI